MSTTILLGPQRFTTTVGAVVRSLELTGRVAMVNAGWEEREADDFELAGHLEGRGVNLSLYHRMTDVLEKDEQAAAAVREFRESVDELRAFYGIRLQSAMDAVEAVAHRTSLHDVRPWAAEAAIESVRDVDKWYAAAVAQLHASLRAETSLDSSGIIGWHRGEIGAVLAECEAVVVAGGNVRVLLEALRFFDVSFRPEQAVVAWSAGAMALTDEVVLFHDFAPHGVTVAELHDRGLGRLPGVIALPHAKRRLRLDDRDHMARLARRFVEHRLLLLDDGAVVRFHHEGAAGAGGAEGAARSAEGAARSAEAPMVPAGARIVQADGHVSVVEAA